MRGERFSDSARPLSHARDTTRDRQQPVQADLTILCTTDLHMHLLSYDYLADRAADIPSLARLAPLIRRLRSGTVNSVLLDCGDFLQGGPMGELFGGVGDPRDAYEPHPMLAAMQALGYDAVALGNHEFDFGLPMVERLLRDSPFPVLSCNLVRHRGGNPMRDQTLAQPYALLDRRLTASDGSAQDIRIGVLGLAPPETVQWERARLEGRIEARAMDEAARAWVPELRARGADIVIVLAHAGPATPAETRTVLNLAATPGIDALCLGHVHGVFPAPQFANLPGADIGRGTLGGTPAVMAGYGGSHLGTITLNLRRQGAGWEVAGRSAWLIPADEGSDGTGAPQPERAARGCTVQRSAASAHARTLDHIRTAIGVTSMPVDSFFASLGDSTAQRLVGAALRHWMRHLKSGGPPKVVPVLASVPAFRAGGNAGPDSYTDIPTGALHMRHLHDLYPFPNLLTALRLTGAEVLDWLERTASHYARIAPDTEAALLAEDVPPWTLDAMIGLDYAFDLSRPPRYRLDGTPCGVGAGRVVRARINGRPLDPEAVVIVVTSAHRAAGGGVFRHWPVARQLPCPPTLGREALIDYVAATGRIVIPPVHAPRLIGPTGARLLFDTAPAAARHLCHIAPYRPEVVTTTPDGYLRLRLHLPSDRPREGLGSLQNFA